MDQDLVDIESIDFTVAQLVDCVGHVRHKLSKARKVVVRHGLAWLLSLRLPGHELRPFRPSRTGSTDALPERVYRGIADVRPGNPTQENSMLDASLWAERDDARGLGGLLGVAVYLTYQGVMFSFATPFNAGWRASCRPC